MSPGLQAAVALIALLAVVVPIWLVAHAPHIRPKPRVVISHRIVPKTELPPVDPVELQTVDPNDARAINESIPFSSEPNSPARPFHISGSAVSQARAIDCLAAAVYYEAGDDAVGQTAVAQVILNRARHPAFPRTICGVVFQGSERSTGCQFTFTCDGSMLRRSPSPAAWERARAVARMALNGTVDKRVGLATHYHTDWVVPYWSASLEKISAVDDSYGRHLFFRWAGWWGTPPAFNHGYGGVEPNIGLMARMSGNFVPAAESALVPGAASTAIDPDSIPASVVPPSITGDSNSFLVTLPKGMNPDSFASLAIRTCGERAYCKFMAWADGSKTPPRLPLSSTQVASMSFSYLRDENQSFSKALWNCEQYSRPSPVQCMRAQPLAHAALPPASAPAPQPDLAGRAAAGPGPLMGVRRKGETSPTPMPASSPQSLPPAPKPSPTTASKAVQGAQ